jgi:hypothetical protein
MIRRVTEKPANPWKCPSGGFSPLAIATVTLALVLAIGLAACSIYGSWDLLALFSLSRSEVIDPDNWEQIREYLNWVADQGVSSPPTVDTTTIGVPAGGNKWYGGVLAPNGKIYCIPWDADTVLVINPTDDTSVDFPVPNPPGATTPTSQDKWLGGVLAPNDKIYCIPYDATDVMVIDPATDTAAFPAALGGFPGSGSHKWHGGAVARNGKIYCVPADASTVLVIDPGSDSKTEIFFTAPPPSDAKWYGGVLAPNGKIYCIPWHADYVMIIDPATNAVDPDAISISTVAEWKYNGGVLAPNGKIYCVPRDPNRILIIDPNKNSASLVSNLPGSIKWAGGVLAPDGKIYGMPRDATSVLIIDPASDTTDTSTLTVPAGAGKWTGGVLAPNGKIYGIPNEADSVLIIDVHSNGEVFSSIAECAYFNKF